MKRKLGYLFNVLSSVSFVYVLFYGFQGHKQDGLLVSWFGSSVEYVFYVCAIVLIVEAVHGFILKNKENTEVVSDQK